MSINGLTLEFKVYASKRRLKWKKNKQYATLTCAFDSTSPKEGGEGGSRMGYLLAVSPFATFLKVYFGPINFDYYF